MHSFHRMKTASVIVSLFLAALATSCATETVSSTTWVDPGAPGYWARTGRVESVQEVVRRVEGHPGAGALAGALIGGFLFGGRGPGALIGAAGGAAIGAAASQGGSEARTYQVTVRFDDGSYGTFFYNGFSPFRPGDPVVATPQGLARP